MRRHWIALLSTLGLAGASVPAQPQVLKGSRPPAEAPPKVDKSNVQKSAANSNLQVKQQTLRQQNQPGKTTGALTPPPPGQAGNAQITKGNGNTAITKGNGNNAITKGNNTAITKGNGNTAITKGSPNNAVTKGSNTAITKGNGNTAITKGSPNNAITKGNNAQITKGNTALTKGSAANKNALTKGSPQR